MIFVLGGATYGLARLFRGAWWVSSGWGWAHGEWRWCAPSRPDIPRVGRRGMALPSLRENRLGPGPVRQAGGCGPPRRLAGRGRSGGGLLRHRASGPQESTEELLDETETQSSQGGSEFENERAVDRRLPLATGTILFRPYLWEASGTGQLLTALEGAVLLALIIHARHELIRPREAFREPYLMFALVFTIAFIIGFSSVANFGILVRQRTQLFPIFLVLLSMKRSGPPPAPAPVAEQVGEHAHRPSGVNGSDRSERAIHSAASACDPPRRSARAILSPSWHRPAGSPPPRLRTCRRAGGGRRGPAAVTGSEVAERMARVSRPFRVP